MAVPTQYSPGLEEYGGVDKQTSGLVQQNYEQAGRSAEDYQQDFSGGARITPETFKQREAPLGGEGTDVLNRAIERRATQEFSQDQAQMQRDIQAQAIELRFKRLQNAAQLVSAEHQQNYKARMNKYIAEQNKRRARAAALGNILGIGGAIGGGMMGGPGGAAAGYQMGQGVGQMSGGGF